MACCCSLGEAAEEGELQLGSKLLGNAPLTTRERIRRDRELHRLGLHLVERIPKDVLVDLVQVTVCDLHSQDAPSAVVYRYSDHASSVSCWYCNLHGSLQLECSP